MPADTQPSQNRFKAVNPPLDGNAITYLTADSAVGATSLTILDKAGFLKAEHNNDTNFYVVIGNYGQEKSEIVKVTADDTVNTTLTVAATVYAHEASEPITFIPYNQVRLYGSAASGTIVIGDTPVCTINIDCSKQHTNLYYEGSTNNYFKIAYYNVANTELSAFSEEISSTSFTRKSAKRIIESALTKAITHIDESENSELSWDKALTVLQDGIDEIMARKRKWVFLHKIDESTSTVANIAYISKPSDLSLLEFIIIDDNTLGWISRYKYDNYTKNGATVSTGSPAFYTEKNGKYYLYPTPSTVYAVIFEYFKTVAEITDLATEVDLAFVPVLIYYCASQFAYIRGNDKRGDKMYAMFQKLLEQQVEEYSGPEQVGEAEAIEQTTNLNEEINID
jgi:hypothetical protein